MNEPNRDKSATVLYIPTLNLLARFDAVYFQAN